jgi:hypothetical protein
VSAGPPGCGAVAGVPCRCVIRRAASNCAAAGAARRVPLRDHPDVNGEGGVQQGLIRAAAPVVYFIDRKTEKKFTQKSFVKKGLRHL